MLELRTALRTAVASETERTDSGLGHTSGGTTQPCPGSSLDSLSLSGPLVKKASAKTMNPILSLPAPNNHLRSQCSQHTGYHSRRISSTRPSWATQYPASRQTDKLTLHSLTNLTFQLHYSFLTFLSLISCNVLPKGRRLFSKPMAENF